MKKLNARFIAVIVLAAVFVGCNNTTNETSSTVETPSTETSSEEVSSEETVDPATKLTTILADVKAAYADDAFYENDKANLAWYPQNAAKTEAAKIIAHGDYVFYIILGNHPSVEEELSEADAIAFAEEQIKKAVDVINAAF